MGECWYLTSEQVPQVPYKCEEVEIASQDNYMVCMALVEVDCVRERRVQLKVALVKC